METSFCFGDPNKTVRLENRDHLNLINKWGLSFEAQMYTFDKNFTLARQDEFLQEFARTVLGFTGKLSVTELNCTVTSMEFFERLLETKSIVRANGSLVQCMEYYLGDIAVCSNLREFLLSEDSPSYGLYSEEERKELIFCIFKHLVIGGDLCQYEDDIGEYLNLTKVIYKQLVSVRQVGDIPRIVTTSQVSLLRGDSPVYTIVDPLRKTITTYSP